MPTSVHRKGEARSILAYKLNIKNSWSGPAAPYFFP